jgi:hypothetical protein
VPTLNFSFHPFVHYGAVNIPGSDLLMGINLRDVGADKTFMKYFGPAPPPILNFVPILRRQRYLYEWIIAKQNNGFVPKPKLPIKSNLRVKFRKFLRSTDVVASSNLRSGFCVRNSEK